MMTSFLVSLIAGNSLKNAPKESSAIIKKLIILNALDLPRHIEQSIKNDELTIEKFIAKNPNLIIKLNKRFTIALVLKTPSRVFLNSFDSSYKDDFLLANKNINVYNHDIVLCEILKKRGFKGRQFALIQDVLKQSKKTILGIVLKNGSKSILLNLEELQSDSANLIKLSHKISKKALDALPDGCVIEYDKEKNTIINVLGVLDDPKIDSIIALKLFDKEREFSQDILDFAKSFEDIEVDIDTYKNRVDLSNLPFVTIDPFDAKDHDDAIYFDTACSKLYVAIADVSHYVGFNSILDKAALNRGFSIYFPDFVVPMLPFSLSSGICSLEENKLRLAFVWEIELDAKSGAIGQFKLYEAIIKNHQNIDYQNVQKALNNKNKDNILLADVFSWLKVYAKLVDKISKNRLKNGFEFESLESKITLNQDETLKSASKYQTYFSNSIIEESMLLANKMSASMLEQNIKNNGIFRIHPSPKEDKILETFQILAHKNIVVKKSKNLHSDIEQIQALSTQLGIREYVDLLLIRSLQKASYSTKNIGHFALGFDAYSHFTSPIRRYADLHLHRILKAILHDDSKMLKHLLTDLNIHNTLNLREKEIAKIEQIYKDYKFSRYAANHINDELEVIALENKRDMTRAMSLAPIFGARVYIDSSRDISALDILKCKIKSASLLDNVIILTKLK